MTNREEITFYGHSAVKLRFSALVISCRQPLAWTSSLICLKSVILLKAQILTLVKQNLFH